MTKVKIDGKVYCVETLIHERERLIKEVKASSELHRLVLDEIRAEIEFEIDHRTNMLCAEDVFAILDKYKAESEDKE